MLPEVAGPAALSDRAQQRSFLNRYYGLSRSIYDLTRKYYLFGRDAAVEELLAERWDSLVEVGVGTGRNLRQLHARRPGAAYGGVEPCDAMREHARPRVPWAHLIDAFAEDADYASIVGRPPDRIFFSYCLSMVGDPAAGLRRALESLNGSGEVMVVDFGGMRGLAPTLAAAFRRFLAAFHVRPVDVAALGFEPHSLREGPLGYYVIARFKPRARAISTRPTTAG